MRDPIVMLGGALILASLVLKAYVLRQAYFIEDDFLFVADAAAHNLTVEYLTDLHKGHLMPGAKLLAYIQTAISPYNWGLTCGVMMLFQAGAAIGLFRLLWVLFGRRWAILPPLALFLFAPLTMPVLAWWSAALNAIPFQLAIVLALLWTVRYLRSGEARYAWMTAGAVVLGMAFSVKAMFLPPLLFAFAAAFVVQGRLPRVLWRTLDRDMPFWVGMALLSVVHGLVYLSLQETAEGEGPAARTATPRSAWPAGCSARPSRSARWAARGVGAGHPGRRPARTGGLGGRRGLGGAAGRGRGQRGVPAARLAGLGAARRLPGRGGRAAHRHRPRPLPGDDRLRPALRRRRRAHPRRGGRAGVHPDPGGAAGRPGVRRRPLPPKSSRTAAVAGTLVFAAFGGYSTYAFADTLSGDRVRWYLDTVRASVEGFRPRPGSTPGRSPTTSCCPGTASGGSAPTCSARWRRTAWRSGSGSPSPPTRRWSSTRPATWSRPSRPRAARSSARRRTRSAW
ncbi:hypothetical protein ACFQXA_29360 [Nocardiopsis composta]